MSEEPADEYLIDQFKNITAPELEYSIAIMSLRDINRERQEIASSIERYMGYKNTLMPRGAEWGMVTGYLLYLARELGNLSATESAILQDFTGQKTMHQSTPH